MKLTEGLRKGDLNGMVLPLISIDEFSSKIDDRTVIVVAFYSFEEDPAHDLSNFIERSPVNVLDTDVSPAPTREGYYVTFVEIKRNQDFIPKLIKILQEINNLTDVKQWQFTSQKLPKGKVLAVSEEHLKKWVQVKPDLPVNSKPSAEALREWLQHSDLQEVIYQEPYLHLHRQGMHHVYEVVQLTENAPTQAMCFEPHAVSQTHKLQRLLNESYQVHHMGDSLVVEHDHTFLILKSPQ